MGLSLSTLVMSALLPVPIFNTHYSASVDSTFHLFPRLPKELRLQIWHHALHGQRIIRIQLTDPDLEDPDTYEERHRALQPSDFDGSPTVGSGRYSVRVDNFQSLNKLLYICQESRRETLTYFRAHIPCKFAHGKNGDLLTDWLHEGPKGVVTPGVLYFNPESDFLKISCFPNGTKAGLPSFLHDLKTALRPSSFWPS